MAKILMVVEGGKREVRLMRHLFKVYGIADKYEVFSYNSKIYSLYSQMFVHMDPSEADLLQVLKEREKDTEARKILDQRFSDILLIFDLDPQDNQFSNDKIREMMEYFNESSDNGKLYINYPMVESFYHMKSIPDPEYINSIVTFDELKRKKYKERVQIENRNKDYSKFAVNKAECNTVIHQNYEKAMRISNKVLKDYLGNFEIGKEVLEKQLSKMDKEKCLYVLCTCIFFILDYNPALLEE